ncbi:MAG: hypothetical protein ACFFE4_11785, partial [Candidatus Thorarchaeota archaeon]
GGTISGWEHHIWNGMTTLQFAQVCEKIIRINVFDKLMKVSYVHHFLPNEIVNKYELMNIFNEVFNKQLTINRVNNPNEKVDRSLDSNYNELYHLFGKSDIKTALYELISYIDNSEIYEI